MWLVGQEQIGCRKQATALPLPGPQPVGSAPLEYHSWPPAAAGKKAGRTHLPPGHQETLHTPEPLQTNGAHMFTSSPLNNSEIKREVFKKEQL